MPASLVRRLSLGAAGWVGLLGLTVASVAVWQYWHTSLRTMDARLHDDARAIAGRIGVANGLLEIEIDAAIGTGLQNEARYYAVYDAAGQLLDGTPAGAADGPAPATPFRTRAGYREAVAAGPRESVVVVGESLAPVYADVRRLTTSLLLASLLGAVLTLPLAVWLRRQLARSLDQIDGTARSLAPGKPTRIDVRQVAAEFVGVATALNDAFDRLEGALARERHLTADASHELRTPVTTLVAETQWALGAARSAGEYRRSLEVCARQGRRMKDLVESLLTLARLESGALPPALSQIPLRPLVDEAVAELAPLARQQQVGVTVEGDAMACADPVQMRILLTNLVSNAIRYNRPGGEVLVAVRHEDGRTRLRVSDTGVGLDPAVAPRAFERFWRADPSRSARDGGSGLGLAITSAIVAAHAGTIAVHSEPGKGTTVAIELPTEPSAAGALPGA